MSEPTYGSQYDPQRGYGQQQPYGGQPYGGDQPPQQPQYPGGYQSGYQQQQPGGYPSGSYPASPAPAPAAKAPQDKLALAATLLTVVGYVCAGAGVLGFILWLASDGGDGIARFAGALGALVLGIGLGGLNYGLGVWLGERRTGS